MITLHKKHDKKQGDHVFTLWITLKKFLERLMCWMVEKARLNVQGLKRQFTFSQEHVDDYIVVTQKYAKLKVTFNIHASTFLILL
jgi:hypothetical protein